MAAGGGVAVRMPVALIFGPQVFNPWFNQIAGWVALFAGASLGGACFLISIGFGNRAAGRNWRRAGFLLAAISLICFWITR